MNSNLVRPSLVLENPKSYGNPGIDLETRAGSSPSFRKTETVKPSRDLFDLNLKEAKL